MTVRLYTDVHVPFPIIHGLRARGVDVLTAQEDGTTTLADSELLDRATSLDRVLFTQDQDLLSEAARRQQAGTPFAGVIYAHQQRLTVRQFIAELELVAKVADPADLANRVTYLPLS